MRRKGPSERNVREQLKVPYPESGSSKSSDSVMDGGKSRDVDHNEEVPVVDGHEGKQRGADWLSKSRAFGIKSISRLNRQAAALFGAVGLLWIALSFATPNFFTTQNIGNIALQSSVIGILAVGFTVVLIGGEIDLSIGSTQALAGTLAAFLIIQLGSPIWVGIVSALLVGVAIGTINGYFTLIARVPSFIVTLAMLGIVQGAAFVLTSGRTVGGFPSPYEVLGRGRIGVVPLPVVILLLVVAVAQFVLTQTKFGVELYAIGGNRNAAELVGLRVTRTLMVAFIASATLCTLAGLVLSSRLNAGHGSFGGEFLLEAVAAVIIGGTSLSGGAGSTFGTLAGVLLMSSIKNGLIHLGVDTFWQQVVVGILILAAVLVDQILKGTLHARELVPSLRRT